MGRPAATGTAGPRLERWTFPATGRDVDERIGAAMTATIMRARTVRRPDGVAPPPGFRVARLRFAGVSLVETATPTFAVERRAAAIGGDGDRAVVVLVLAGAQRMVQGGVERLVGPGDACLWDAARPGRIDVLEPTRKLTLVLPRDEVPALDGALPGVLPAAAPHARVLRDVLTSLGRELPGMDAADAAAAAGIAGDVVRLAWAPQLRRGPRTVRRALLPEVLRHVERHLGDPDLDPAAIARAAAVSVRTLHAMFAPTGETVTAAIRRLRLERAAAELRAHPDVPVARIAAAVGFRNPSHFARAFRDHHGCSPTVWRRTGPDPDGPS